MRFTTRILLAGAAAGAMALALGTPPASATTWSAAPSPNRGTWVNVLSDASALSPGSAWSVGNWYDTSLASTRTLALRWNGTQWSTVTTPNVNNFYNELYGVDAVSATSAWAVGGFATGQSGGGNGNNGPHSTLALRWNGTSWTRVATPNPGTSYRDLYDVDALSTGDAWAVGYYYGATAATQSLITHWNGTAWSQVPSPNPANYQNILHGVSGSGADDVWAVGWYTAKGEPAGSRHPLFAHWNGAAWSEVEPAFTGNASLNAVAALSPTNAWAVGSKNGYRTPVVFHWDGTTWAEVPTPAVGSGGNNPLYNVTAVDANTVWAAGYQTTGSAGPQPLVERWNGTAWQVEPIPVLELGGLTQGVAAVPGSVWAVGYKNAFSGGSTTNRTLVLRGQG